MAVFSQDMSFFTEEYMRTDSNFSERLNTLEAVRDTGYTGIGEFYHNALKYFLLRSPDIRTKADQEDAEKSAIILCQGLGAEKYTAAANEVWQVVELFDVVRVANDGNTMQVALITMGQIDAKDFVTHIVQRLNNFNTQTIIDRETRRRVQMGVIGCINALEALKDIRGYRPVFFVTVGTFDPAVRNIASAALPNIVDDPSEVIIEVINDTSSDPRVKLTAWRELMRTKAPDSSKAKVASAALAVGWLYSTTNQNFLRNLREMRKEAIDTIRQFGAADPSVYTNMDLSYRRNFENANPDYDEIMLTLNTLTALSSDEAVDLLLKFLRELHDRRRRNVWSNKEKRVFNWVVACIGKTKTQSVDVRILLTTIQRTTAYTPSEQNLAGNALKDLGTR